MGIDLPFSLVEKVVTTIFHGKQKKLRNTVKQLFPKPMICLAEKMMAEAGVPERFLDLAAINSLCHSYQRIVDENPSLAKYRHESGRAQSLGPLVFADGQIFVAGQDRLSSVPLDSSLLNSRGP